MIKVKKRIFIICILVSLYNFSQKSIDVKNIKGTCFIEGDISPNNAKIKALNDAKINALKDAGINESISSYQILFTNQDKNDYTQFFSSDIQSELQGAVKSVKITNEKTYCTNDNKIIFDITIDAEVIKYNTKADITFKANINGIKAVYNNNDNLTFNVTTTQKCFLTIFNITDSEANLLFPNSFEKKSELNKNEKKEFPTEKIDYSLGSNQNKQETNRLIFVFTKKEIPFIKIDENQVTKKEEIFNWLYSIPPDERYVEYYTISILK